MEFRAFFVDVQTTQTIAKYLLISSNYWFPACNTKSPKVHKVQMQRTMQLASILYKSGFRFVASYSV